MDLEAIYDAWRSQAAAQPSKAKIETYQDELVIYFRSVLLHRTF